MNSKKILLSFFFKSSIKIYSVQLINIQGQIEDVFQTEIKHFFCNFLAKYFLKFTESVWDVELSQVIIMIYEMCNGIL